MKKKEQNLREMEETIKRTVVYKWEYQERDRKNIQKLRAGRFPNLMKKH